MDKAINDIRVTETGCWEWKKSKNKQGYGKIGRKTNGKMKHYSTHRFFYEYFVAPIPDGMCVMHKCDNPPCCNPDHLTLGTMADNIQDCVNKGRNYKGPKPWVHGKKGSEHPSSKLTEDNVKMIRHLYFSEIRSQKEIADFYGVSFQRISKICRKEIWKHVGNVTGTEFKHGSLSCV